MLPTEIMWYPAWVRTAPGARRMRIEPEPIDG